MIRLSKNSVKCMASRECWNAFYYFCLFCLLRLLSRYFVGADDATYDVEDDNFNNGDDDINRDKSSSGVIPEYK